MATLDSDGRTLAAVVVTRRAHTALRLGLCVVIALVFHQLTGPVAAAIWAATYFLLQLGEWAAFRSITAETAVGPWTGRAILASTAVNNIAFAALGLIECLNGGVWGVICAGLLWSGAILNGTMVSGPSRAVLIASIAPPALHFLAIPYFVLEAGGTLSEGLAILAGGLLNGLAAFAIWSMTRGLQRNAAEERETARLALRDPETQLPNRYAAERMVEARRGRPGTTLVVAIGINRYQRLHAAIGHAQTVALVGELARRMGEALPEAEVALLSTRTIGLVWTVDTIDAVPPGLARLTASLAAPIEIGGNRIDATATIGFSGADAPPGPTADMSAVDRAMIAVDQARAARVAVSAFDREDYGDPSRHLSLMSEMLRALGNGEMRLAYQPKLDLRTHHVTDVEALVRWRHPLRGDLAPDQFLPMAEETGHIRALTEWVVRQAIADQKLLAEAGHRLGMSINFSGRLLTDPAFAERMLAEARGACGRICFEVTETAVIDDPEVAAKVLASFRAAGLSVSIDDYGSGLSSLAYLKTIPADELKIDKTFVINMAASHTDSILVRSAVDLGHSLGLRVVAEGVETDGALALLETIHCDYAQGFYIARPMLLPQLLAWLAETGGIVGTAPRRQPSLIVA